VRWSLSPMKSAIRLLIMTLSKDIDLGNATGKMCMVHVRSLRKQPLSL
jgi:hypothetical protein